MNSPTRTSLFVLSGMFVLTGAVMYASRWIYAPYLMAAGSAGITFCYMTLPPEAHFRRRRLRRINVFAGILMIAASVFMYMSRNEWVVFILIAALLQLYTSVAGRRPEN
jgi:predicted PurR-regulated permease PerM